MNEEQVRSAIKVSEDLLCLIQNVSRVVANIRGVEGKYESYEFCKDGSLEANFRESSRCSCCSDEYHYVGFPLRYLWEAGWANEERDRIEAEKKAEEAEKQAVVERQKQLNEESERRMLEALKAKYEKDSHD